jgi:hypothetical protein
MDKNTLFSSLWYVGCANQFFKLEHVQSIQQDKYSKKVTTKIYLLIFFYSHLHEKDSLRAISDGLLDESNGTMFDQLQMDHFSKE